MTLQEAFFPFAIYPPPPPKKNPSTRAHSLESTGWAKVGAASASSSPSAAAISLEPSGSMACQAHQAFFFECGAGGQRSHTKPESCSSESWIQNM
jgi:hypothetical protein